MSQFYLIEELTGQQREKLKEAGIAIEVFEEETQSYLIAESDYDGVLTALNCKGKSKDSAYEGIKILQLKTIKDKTVKESEKAKKLASRDEERDERSRMRYVKACMSRMEELKERARLALLERAKQVPAVQGRLFDSAQSRFILDTPVETDEDKSALRAKLQQEFDTLKGMEKVRSVRVSGTNLIVQTNLLLAQAPESLGGLAHEIGEFTIIIPLKKGVSEITLLNTTRKVDGTSQRMNAPYVFQNGQSVMSETRQTIIELLAQMELATVVELSIQIVETVEDDEFGRHVTNWPRDRNTPPPAPPAASNNIFDRYGESVNRFVRREPRRNGRWAY